MIKTNHKCNSLGKEQLAFITRDTLILGSFAPTNDKLTAM